MISFVLNNEVIHTDIPSGMTVLDFIRYHKHLMGTKIGCREGDCGACTVMVGNLTENEMHYQSMTSCLMPLSNAAGKHIVSVEGINAGDKLTPVQKAVVEENGTQCGFCTVGFVMSFTNYCLNHKSTSAEAAIQSIDGNICRCTGYKSLERAAHSICKLLHNKNGMTSIPFAVDNNIVPDYFLEIPDLLRTLSPSKIEEENNTGKHRISVGGGTDVYVQKPEDLVHVNPVSVFNRHDLKFIREENNYIEIGAAIAVTDLWESPLMNEIFPGLSKHLKLVSSTPIRNMATIGGNIVNASPIGDMTIWFLAMDATVVLQNGITREVALKDFFQGYKKLAKTSEEIIEKIRFKKPAVHSFFNFEKVSKRMTLDIATVNTALYMEIVDGIITVAHVSAGGVAPIPLYMKNLSSCLINKTLPFDDESVEELDFILQSEISPLTDVRGSEEYKRMLLRQLFHDHFIEFENRK